MYDVTKNIYIQGRQIYINNIYDSAMVFLIKSIKQKE